MKIRKGKGGFILVAENEQEHKGLSFISTLEFVRVENLKYNKSRKLQSIRLTKVSLREDENVPGRRRGSFHF